MILKRRRAIFKVLAGAALLLVMVNILRGCMNAHSRPIGHGDIAFDISPSGKQIVFNAAGDGGRDLYLLDLKIRRVVRLLKSPDYEGSPAFSPDGNSIIYAAGVVGDRADHIFVRCLDGSSSKQLTTEDYNDQAPSFSPDGSEIVFTRNLTYNWGGLAASWGTDEITCAMKSDGSQLRRITSQYLNTIAPHFSSDEKAVSPDGKKLAFAKGHYSPDYQIYIRNIGGKAARQLTHIDGGCFKPRFSPDGKRIFFLVESWPDGSIGTPKYSLWQIGIGGENASQVADSRLFDDPLTWKP